MQQRRSLRPSARREGRGLLLFSLIAAASAAPLHAQSQQEPTLEQVRALFQQPGLSVHALIQAVADPGIDDQQARMRVPEARLGIAGVLDQGFRYELQAHLVGSPSILDARVGWASGDAFAVDAGRFKTPFSREFLTYIGSTDFIDRARVVNALAPDRQLGVQLSGQVTDNVGWAVGGFTGGADSGGGEPLLGVVRLAASSIELGEGALAFSGQAGFGQDGAIGSGFGGTGFRGDGLVLGFDGRYESGRLLLGAEYIRAEWDPSIGADQDAEGLFATAGWRLEEKHQVLARWDRYRGVVGEADDALMLGYNVFPTQASRIQFNGIFPLRDSALPYRLLVNFQIGF